MAKAGVHTKEYIPFNAETDSPLPYGRMHWLGECTSTLTNRALGIIREKLAAVGLALGKDARSAMEAN